MSTKILLVDDEVNLVDPMSFSLQQKGYQTAVAYNGREALEKLPDEKPDIVLLDWSMPDLSGIDVLKHIRADNNQIPVLMITGKSSKEDIVEGLTAGADLVVT